MTSPLYTKIRETATAFITSYETATKNRDPSLLSSTLSPTCHRYHGPGTLLTLVPSLSAGLTNKEYEAHLQPEVTQLYASAKVTIRELVVDEYAKKASLMTLHTCTTHAGETYEFEFSWTLYLDEDGEKIVKVLEWADTA